jgi:hypothetical protein
VLFDIQHKAGIKRSRASPLGGASLAESEAASASAIRGRTSKADDCRRGFAPSASAISRPVSLMPKPWQPLNVLIAAEEALASAH